MTISLCEVVNFSNGDASVDVPLVLRGIGFDGCGSTSHLEISATTLA